jgi:hypothetical protein
MGRAATFAAMEGSLRAHDALAADWVAALLASCLLVLATISIGSPRKWRLLRQAAFRMRIGRQALRDETDLGDRSILGLLTVAVISMGLFLWQCAALYRPDLQATFGLVVAGVAAVLLAQGIALRLSSLLAGADGGTREHLFTGTLLHTATGLALLPIAVLMAYQVSWRPALTAAGLGLLALAAAFRWLRGAWIGAGEGVSPRYIILYLCAAELLPFLLAWHALRQSLPST